MDEVIDDEAIHDPQFHALLAYIETATERFMSEFCETKESKAEAAEATENEASEDLDAKEAEPGTLEYDIRNGIPYYEVF